MQPAVVAILPLSTKLSFTVLTPSKRLIFSKCVG